jgi:hypothetical protein
MAIEIAERTISRPTRVSHRGMPIVPCLVVILCSACERTADEQSPPPAGEAARQTARQQSQAPAGDTPQPAGDGEAAGDAEPAGDVEPASAGTGSSGDIPPVVMACAACHELPPPDILPTRRWPHMITRMKLTIEQYKLGSPFQQLEIEQILRYYMANSPPVVNDVVPDYGEPTVEFVRQVFGRPARKPAPGVESPIIGNLNTTDLDRNGHADVVVSDIIGKELTWVAPREGGVWAETTLATIAAPARTEVVDIDADGDLDIIVGDIGTMQPTDELVGQVILLEGDEQLNFTPRVLVTQEARCCDVRPADIDGDGDLDILYAAYGLFNVGHAAWLEQKADGSYARHIIYTRSGISHLPVADLNGDDRPDFIALLSQQHEQIIAFINRGSGQFDEQLLFKGPHPMWGASHLQLVDLDQDGDSDAVFTNGDALDAEPWSKPWHAAHWLENRGNLEFVHHEIVRYPGAYSVAVGDLDGDQDLDLVVTSMMNKWQDMERQSIIWLENDGQQQFTPQRLSNSPTYLATSAVGDFDANGRLDVIAGGMYVYQPYYRIGRITGWRNLGPAK